MDAININIFDIHGAHGMFLLPKNTKSALNRICSEPELLKMYVSATKNHKVSSEQNLFRADVVFFGSRNMSCAINIKNISVDGAHASFLLPGASEGARFQPRGYQIYL